MCIHLSDFPFHLMRCAALSCFFGLAESLRIMQAIQTNCNADSSSLNLKIGEGRDGARFGSIHQ